MRRVVLAALVVTAVAAVAFFRMRETSKAGQLAAAQAARKSGQFDAADLALAGLPQSLPVQLERAEIRLARGDSTGAFGLLKTEAAEGPSDGHFWARYGFLAAVLGETDVAKMALTRAALGSPAEPEAATHLVQVLKREDPAKAPARIKSLEAQAAEPSVRAVFAAASAP